MSVSITITYSDIIGDVRGQVSILAKRSVSRDGKSNYDAVSFSGIEEADVRFFIPQACDACAGELSRCVTATTHTDGTSVAVTVDPTRGFKNASSDTGFASAFESAFKGYVVAHVMYEYLSLIQSPVAQKYLNDMGIRMRVLKDLVYVKSEPSGTAVFVPNTTTGKDYSSIGGELAEAVPTVDGDPDDNPEGEPGGGSGNDSGPNGGGGSGG